MKKKFLLFSLAITLFLIMQLTSDLQAAKKKLYINTISIRRGVSKAIAEKARDYMILSILENYRNDYQLVTDDDIKVMYKRAANIMASGCDAQSCVMQIADAINADEIIYGNLSREGSKIRLSIQNLRRDRKTLSVSKKSLVNISFFESQLEWYCKEIAKKLVMPDYNVGFSLEREDLKGLDIGILRFKTDDRTLSMMINYFKEMVEEGDTLFREGRLSEARDKYNKVISRIDEKLREESRRSISKFIAVVCDRIATCYEKEGDSYYSEYKFRKSIDNYDSGINILRDSKIKTENVLEKINKLNEKRKVAMQTGTSWLENKVRSSCDQAEYLNIKDKKGEAKDILKNAGWIIGANKVFSNNNIEAIYAKTCSVIGFDAKGISKRTFDFKKKRKVPYGALSIAAGGLTAATFSIGIYFTVQHKNLISDYNSTYNTYIILQDFLLATSYSNKLKKIKDDSDKNELISYIIYGIGGAFTIVSGILLYKYISYRITKSKMDRSISGLPLFMPLYCYRETYSFYTGQGEHYFGGLFSFRF